MKLAKLARAALLLCGMLLMVVALVMFLSLRQIDRERQEIGQLLRLQSAISGLAAPATSLVFAPVDPGIRALYRSDAAAVMAELERLGGSYPDASKAAEHLGAVLEAGDSPPAGNASLEGMPQARARVARLTTSAIAALSAVQDATIEARADIEASSRQLNRLLIVVSALFGALCITAFWLIQQRLGVRVGHLAEQVRELRGGARARASLAGDDELTDLAQALNDLAEGQEQALAELRAQREELEYSEEMLQESQRVGQIGSARYYPAERRMEWTPEAFRVFGAEPGDGAPSPEAYLRHVHPDDRDRLAQVRRQAATELKPYLIQYRLLRARETTTYIEERSQPFIDDAGTLRYWYGTLQDITDREFLVRGLEDANRELERQTRIRELLIDSLPANIAMLDAEGNILEVNEQWRRYAIDNNRPLAGGGEIMNYLEVCDRTEGREASDARRVAAGLRAIMAGARKDFVLEYPCHPPEGRQWYRLMARPLHDDGGEDDLRGIVVMHVDITERVLAEEEVRYIAFNDPLTGLLSRAGLTQQIDEQLAGDSGGLMVVLDLVNFHDVNDSYGIQAGDALLKELAARLRALRPAAVCIARLGADSFAAYFAPATATAAARGALADLFESPFRGPDEAPLYASAEFGAVRDSKHRGMSAADLLQQAELALFHGKRTDRQWMEFTDELLTAASARIQTTSELKLAMEREELVLFFQPKVNLRSGALIACEALLRWQHPDRGLQSPAAFIPVAEQSKLILPIGNWVLREACRHLTEWRGAGLDVVAVSVNVSMVQLMHRDFPGEVRQALEDFGVLPEHLTLELTESAFTEESAMLRGKLERLRELGVRLSLDDFGTGYSSLQYLKNYPFQEVKIDQSFVRDLPGDRYNRSIVRNVIAVAEAIGAETLAEGIESSLVAEELLELGCERGQGFYFSLPLEAEDFRWLLEQRSLLPLAST